MANRKGVFIGAYVPNHLKESLRRRAAAEHRTLSQEITRILEEAVHGRACQPVASTGEIKRPHHGVGQRIPLRVDALSTSLTSPGASEAMTITNSARFVLVQNNPGQMTSKPAID